MLEKRKKKKTDFSSLLDFQEEIILEKKTTKKALIFRLKSLQENGKSIIVNLLVEICVKYFFDFRILNKIWF
jgi:hypothetical protein